MEELTAKTIRKLIPHRAPDGHKGTFGHVFIIGGSTGYSGAPVLAGNGALRSGVGLITIGVPESLGEVSSMGLLEAMTFPLAETKEGTLTMAALEATTEFAAENDAAVIGPGLSLHGRTQQYIVKFIEQCRAPLVIDADGLNALSKGTDCVSNRKYETVLTPHPGEMARILHTATKDVVERTEECALSVASQLNSTVVLKGHRTLIAEPDGTLVRNTTGNNGMGSGGSGDVLAGLIGGLLAQGMTGGDASRLGVYLHGLAGDLAAEYYSQRGMAARDIIHCLPEAWLQLEQD
ncbi:MAG: NAD(P)H-hydrate dehydratase [Candidatus Hydrogenedentota bacterium]